MRLVQAKIEMKFNYRNDGKMEDNVELKENGGSAELKEEYVWNPSGFDTFNDDDICESVEACIEDAKEKLANGYPDFEALGDGDDVRIDIGLIQRESMRKIVKDWVEMLPDHIDDYIYSNHSIDDDSHTSFSDRFVDDVLDAVMPLVEKHLLESPPMIFCNYVKGTYNLTKDKWEDLPKQQ